MLYHDNVLNLIGDTPLMRLKSVTSGLDALVLAKVEYFNPGGSVKDRIAERIIDAAERTGRLRPGGTIVEPTSGNTGVGLMREFHVSQLPVLRAEPSVVTGEVAGAINERDLLDAVMVLIDGKPTGVLTRQDLLHVLGSAPR